MEELRILVRTILKEMEEKVHLEKISSEQINNVINVCDNIIKVPHFSKVCGADERLKNLTETDKSIVLKLGEEIIGFYLLSSKESIEDFIHNAEVRYNLSVKINDEQLFNTVKTKNGVQGLAVGIYEKFRGIGYGKMLLKYPNNIGYDYIWGVQTKGLSNLEPWLKRRKLLATISGHGQEFYITVELF